MKIEMLANPSWFQVLHWQAMTWKFCCLALSKQPKLGTCSNRMRLSDLTTFQKWKKNRNRKRGFKFWSVDYENSTAERKKFEVKLQQYLPKKKQKKRVTSAKAKPIREARDDRERNASNLDLTKMIRHPMNWWVPGRAQSESSWKRQKCCKLN